MTEPVELHQGLARAASLCDLGRFAEAERMLGQLLAVEPSNVRALCLLSQSKLGQDQPAAALQVARSASAAAPDHEWPYRLASVALSQLNRPGESVEMARNAVRVAPFSATGYAQLAQALIATKQLDEARWAADEAVRLDPNDADNHLMVGAVAAASRNQTAAAAAAFHRALAIDPQHSAAHNELARLSLKKSRYLRPGALAAAAGGFETALRADPRASVSRRNVEITLHSFLSRTAYGIFMVVLLSISVAGPDPNSAARFIPAAMLVLPGCYAARFVQRLSPPMRAFLAAAARKPLVLGAIGCETVAAVLLIVGAVLRQTLGPFGVAAGFAILGRILLWTAGRLRFGRTRRFVYPTARLRIAMILLAVCTALFLALAALPGNPAPWTVVIPASLTGLPALAAWQTLRRRRKAAEVEPSG